MYASATDLGTVWTNGANQTLSTGRWTGEKSVSLGSQSIYQNVSDPGPTFSVCFAAKTTSPANALNFSLPILYNAAGLSTPQCCLAIQNSAGTVTVCRGGTAGTNVLGTSAVGAFPPDGQWHYIEWTVTLNATTGSFTVKVDGNTVLTGSGVNTLGSGSSTAIGSLAFAGTSSTWQVADVYLTNGASLGEMRFPCKMPNSDSSVQWTKNTGASNNAAVNQLPTDGDTTYVSSSTPGQIDKYGMAALGISPSTIPCVRVFWQGRKDDVSARQVRSKLYSGVTTSNGVTQALGSSYAFYSDLYQNDPNTSAAWTITGLDACLGGIEEIA